jgi:drug/metabolite transporter (DMT)-like permease
MLGLGSGLCWGTADFMGGLQSRRMASQTVTLWSQIVGGLLLALLLLLLGPPIIAGWRWAVAAGICGATALLLFYRALAIGTMAIVAPVSASGAVVPVLAGLAQGERVSLLTGLGILVALAGVVLASLQPGTGAARSPRLSVGLALGAALGFGLFFTLIDQAAGTAGASPLWINVWSRGGSIPLLLGLQVLSLGGLGWPGARLLKLSLIGVLDTSANVLFSVGASIGDLSVVAVLSSLYPVTTVLLSWALLAERLSRIQYAGVALALSGVLLLAAA